MNLTERDAEAIRQQAPAVAEVSVWSNSRMRVHSETGSHKTGVMGIDRYYFPVRGYSLASGRTFSPSEERSKAKVVILGKTAREELFGSEPGLGHFVRIGKHAYRVVGELTEKGRSTFEDQDDRVLMPISSFRSRIAPSGGDRVQLIMASSRTAAHTEQAQKQIELILRAQHQLREGEPDDFLGENSRRLQEGAG